MECIDSINIFRKDQLILNAQYLNKKPCYSFFKTKFYCAACSCK